MTCLKTAEQEAVPAADANPGVEAWRRLGTTRAALTPVLKECEAVIDTDEAKRTMFPRQSIGLEASGMIIDIIDALTPAIAALPADERTRLRRRMTKLAVKIDR